MIAHTDDDARDDERDDETPDEVDDDAVAICAACNGSGEGCADGTRCRVCRGLGEIPTHQYPDDYERDPDEYPDYSTWED